MGQLTPIIQAEHVAFGYNAHELILKDISFEIYGGQVLMILGANGCGKSTLMRALLSEKQRASGTITLEGTDLRTLNPKQISQKIAMVFQDHNAPFPFRVSEVVAMGRAPYLSAMGSPNENDRKICAESLEMVGISGLADKRYTEISGGERQMVLIARALAQQTPLIMMDEPTSHLDYRNAAVVIEITHRLATEHGKAIIMVTHLPDQAFYYPSHATLMKDGRFFAQGVSTDVLTEANLSATYGMTIEVLKAVNSQGKETTMCRPLPEAS